MRPLPIAAYGLAVVISFVGSMAVRDADGRGQALTRLFAGAAAVLSVFLASLLAPRPVIADLAFLAVIFGAVYIRKFGPRWFAVGMIAFMAYFMGDYLRPHPSDIGWLALAAALALIATHLSTAVLLRDDPERNFRRAVTTIDRRINLILRDLMQAAGDTAAPRASSDPLRAHLARLHDVVLMAEGFIPQGEDGTLAAEGPASELAVALFDLQLAVEQLVRARRDAPPPQPFLRAALAHDDRRLQQLCAEADRETDDAATAGVRLLMRVHRTRARLDAMLAAAPCAAFSRTGAARPSPAQPAPPPAPSAMAIPVSLQRPIQVTLACAIALGCGILLSPVRWYWAVITAFIVFNNTSSRADTAVRALQRSAGTFGGLIAGTVVATVVQGQTAVSIAVILLLFFFAFYFIQVSYGLMIFLITIALALLYGLMGMFTPELLLVRLEETMVGGLAGAAVAFLVFPTRASTGVNTAFGRLSRRARRAGGACPGTRPRPRRRARSPGGLAHARPELCRPRQRRPPARRAVGRGDALRPGAGDAAGAGRLHPLGAGAGRQPRRAADAAFRVAGTHRCARRRGQRAH